MASERTWYQGQDDLGDPLSEIALERIWKAERRVCGSTMRALFGTVANRERALSAAERENTALRELVVEMNRFLDGAYETLHGDPRDVTGGEWGERVEEVLTKANALLGKEGEA